MEKNLLWDPITFATDWANLENCRIKTIEAFWLW